jgi:hypothetical protein
LRSAFSAGEGLALEFAEVVEDELVDRLVGEEDFEAEFAEGFEVGAGLRGLAARGGRVVDLAVRPSCGR